MTLHQLHCSLTSFLARIEHLSGTALHDAFVGEVIETGGTYMDPPADDDGTSHLFEISLHDVVGRGASEPETFANWIQAAERMADRLLDDEGFITVHPPFPNPRNHAEEIANAQAEHAQVSTHG